MSTFQGGSAPNDAGGPMPLTHAEAEALISTRLDAPLDPTTNRALNAHLLGCASCRLFESRVDAMAQGLRALPKLPPSPIVSRQVHERIGRKQSNWMRWWSSTSGGYIGAAPMAAVVVVVLMLLTVFIASQLRTDRDAPSFRAPNRSAAVTGSTAEIANTDTSQTSDELVSGTQVPIIPTTIPPTPLPNVVVTLPAPTATATDVPPTPQRTVPTTVPTPPKPTVSAPAVPTIVATATVETLIAADSGIEETPNTVVAAVKAEPTKTVTAAEKPTNTPQPTVAPTNTATPPPTATLIPEPTATATAEPTATATIEPMETPQPTATATVKPSATPTHEATATATTESTPTQPPIVPRSGNAASVDETRSDQEISQSTEMTPELDDGTVESVESTEGRSEPVESDETQSESAETEPRTQTIVPIGSGDSTHITATDNNDQTAGPAPTIASIQAASANTEPTETAEEEIPAEYLTTVNAVDAPIGPLLIAPDDSAFIFVGSSGLAVANLDGGVDSLGAANAPMWSPDGNYVLYENNPNGLSAIAVLNWDSDVIQQITTGTETSDTPAGWIGGRIYYLRTPASAQDGLELHSAQPDGGDDQIVWTGESGLSVSGYPVSTGDGILIPTQSSWLFVDATGNMSDLGANPYGVVTATTLSPDGSLIAYLAENQVIVASAGNPGGPITAIPTAGSFAWSPDSGQIAVTDGSGISFYTTTGGLIRSIPNVSDLPIAAVGWTNSGIFVLATGSEPGLYQISD